MAERIPCPFVYAKGKKCTGHVVRVEAFKADIAWRLGDDDEWHFGVGQPRSHYHVFCSEKDNHADIRSQDDSQLKFYYEHLPEQLKKIVSSR